jgi:hypothetical protein
VELYQGVKNVLFVVDGEKSVDAVEGDHCADHADGVYATSMMTFLLGVCAFVLAVVRAGHITQYYLSQRSIAFYNKFFTFVAFLFSIGELAFSTHYNLTPP